MDYSDRLRKADWEVRGIQLSIAQKIVTEYHYMRGGSNTATYCHGLFLKESLQEENECRGIAWWIPPTKGAAIATYPDNWQGVLCLSRLVVLPDVPKNAASFLLARSMAMIDRQRWPCLVTYADKRQNHVGTIYKATNWTYIGETKPEAVFVIGDRTIARKAGPHTRTRVELAQLGAVYLGSFSKHKFVHIVG